MSSTFNKFNQFVQNIANGKINLGSDVLKVAFTNSAPTAANQVFGDISEITAGSGYSAGGGTTTQSSSVQTSGTYRLISGNVTTTASGGSIGPFRYVVLYDNTQTSPLKPLIGYYDFGTNVTLNSGDSFSTNFDQTNGILSLA